MYRYEKNLLYIMMFVFGLIPIAAYVFFSNVPAITADIAKKAVETNPFRISSHFEQHIAVFTAFIIKPLYMFASLIIAILLWRKRNLELRSLKWAMIFFFSGESFCAANYLLTENHDSHLFEYFHSLGMVLGFGFAAYSALEWIDQNALNYSNPNKKCALSVFCRHCIKYEAISCGLQKLFLFFGFAGAIVALMPLSAELHFVSYNTKIWDTFYNYSHPLVYQLVEVRYFPVLASVFFLVAVLIMKMKSRDPLHPAKLFFAGAIGTAGFSLFRFIVFQAYRDNLVWMDFWEEITEFLFIAGVVVIFWYFRRSLFGSKAASKSAAFN